jgi:predicted  nucleic acid-binding Zn-ribbon protein
MAKTTKKTTVKAKPAASKKAPKKVIAKSAVKKSKPAKKTLKPVAKKSVPKKPVAKKTVVKKLIKVVKKEKTNKKVEIKKPVVKKLTKIVEKGKKEMVKKAEDVEKKVSEVKKKQAEVAKSKFQEMMDDSSAVVKAAEKRLKSIDKDDSSIENKLRALISLQQIDSKIDKIRIIRGELPLEVQDLEDDIAGILTRIENYTNETNAMEEAIAEKKNAIKQCNLLIKKYESQQANVRNNREYDSLSKEIEFQNLEIQLCEKRIKEYKFNLESKKEIIAGSQKQLDEKQREADLKKAELNDIVEETEKEESSLLAKSLGNQKIIEERLLTAYKKIRKNARNGLAVVIVERDACGGCFNKIPPQRQLDIRIHKKIIVCEYCGRILVDPEIIQS